MGGSDRELGGLVHAGDLASDMALKVLLVTLALAPLSANAAINCPAVSPSKPKFCGAVSLTTVGGGQCCPADATCSPTGACLTKSVTFLSGAWILANPLMSWFLVFLLAGLLVALVLMLLTPANRPPIAVPY